MLLYFACRAQNVDEWILPALERGATVLSDRFTDSTLAYQGAARGLGRDVVMTLHQIACRGLLPDLTIYLDIDLDTSLERAHARNRLIEDKDERRMDEQAVEFHHRVRQEYLKLAEMEPGRIKVIDGRADRKTIAARIWETVHVFENFFGNPDAVTTLTQMMERERIPQTILLSGPEGVGKATLARRFASAVLGGERKVEQDDLSLPANTAIIADREKWASDKRVDDPLVFASHPDFLTFPPDGPLRQISIQQMRLLKERAQFKPLRGKRRVFLIDRIDRANEQAANSLLKTLEEPPDHLIIFMTAENAYDLLPTIRSRGAAANAAIGQKKKRWASSPSLAT